MAMSRFLRHVLKALLVLGLFLGVALAGALILFWPGLGPQAPPAPTPEVADTALSPLEASTRTHLRRLEMAIIAHQALARTQQGAFPEDLRSAAIGLSMWGPVADLSQSVLVALGDRPALRQTFSFAMPLVGWMSQPFLYPLDTQGLSPEQTGQRLLALIDERARQGLAVTLDNVGDASHTAAEAQAYRAFYAELLRAQGERDDHGAAEPLHLSLKLSALVPDLPAALGPEGQATRQELLSALKALLHEGHEHAAAGFFLRIDMEEYAYKHLTLELFRRLVEEEPALVHDPQGHPRLGIVSQAYLRDTARDLVDLAAWARSRELRVPVRLVKGAYEPYEKHLARDEGRLSPVWHYKSSTDANYEALAQYLLKNLDAFQPVFATHNLRTQAHVMALADQMGLDRGQVEFQMLYGMGDPIKAALVDLGYRVREYVPAGPLHRGLGYAGRRFQELANRDNALARSLHGDFSTLANQPHFQGAEDSADGTFSLNLITPDAN